MIPMNNYTTNKKADNEVIVNGVRFMVTDDVAERLMSVINGYVNTNPSDVKVKTKAKSKKADDGKFAVKSDKTVNFTVVCADKKYYVQPIDHLGRRVFSALKTKVGIEYTNKLGFGFKTKKEAEEFAKKPVVITADEANAVVLPWEK